MKRWFLAFGVTILAVLVANAQSLTEEGIKLLKDGKSSEAKPLFAKAIAANPKDAAAHANLGMIYRNLDRDFDKAIAEVEQAVELEDLSAEYHYWLGACYIAKAGSSGMFKAMSLAKKSKAEWERAITLDPKHVEARLSLIQWYLSAPGIAGGSVEKALELAAAVEKLQPARGHLVFAAIYQKEKRWPEAEQSYRQAIAADGKNATSRNSFGYFLLGRNRPDDAIVEFKVAVELTPNDANAHDSLAEGYMVKGQFDEAITEYKAALALDDKFPSSYIGLGSCYEKKAQWSEARANYQRFLDVAPKHRRADEARTKLKELSKKS